MNLKKTLNKFSVATSEGSTQNSRLPVCEGEVDELCKVSTRCESDSSITWQRLKDFMVTSRNSPFVCHITCLNNHPWEWLRFSKNYGKEIKIFL